MLASTPFVLAACADKQLTRAHMLESVTLVAWLGTVMFLFTFVLKFQSVHWVGYRPLTLPEGVYLLSQILTTVGYGDITPAFPRGQVWIGFNVILALCLYASIICEVVKIVRARVAMALAGDVQHRRTAGQPLKDWADELLVRKAPLAKSAATFFLVATIGILFWHYYPGEEKTWMQAVYMSIITLSTVGFGAFTASTEAGKVFGAFWMLFGVGALGALVSTFIQTMAEAKRAQRRRVADVHGEFRGFIDESVGDGSEEMDRQQFLKFALMLTKGADSVKLQAIEARFEQLRLKEECMVRRTTLTDAEGPRL